MNIAKKYNPKMSLTLISLNLQYLALQNISNSQRKRYCYAKAYTLFTALAKIF